MINPARTYFIHRASSIWLRVGLLVLALLTPATLRGALDTSKLPPAATRPVDFVNDIQPLLVSKCVSCHGPEKQKGALRLDRKADALRGGDTHAPDIIPGKSAESPLIHFVAGLVPDLRMPAKGEPLTAEQIGLLRAWIDQGAAWPDDGSAAKGTHWAFKPITHPTLPQTRNAKPETRNPIDAFIVARLAEKKLSLSPPADRRTLVRRLYFDVIGLPPTPEEVEAFIASKAPRAYEELVGQLLASPHYGERWARHWLDAVRFAESDGYETNKPRPNAWPYRDWVIRALNNDLPYDRFILEQLAGDALGADAATGFLTGGATDVVKSPDPVLTANQRADDLHDMVGTTASAFLGLTVGCARCHNHKFDPIPQTDYYAMKAVLAGVRHGERKVRTAEDAAREREMAEHQQKLAAIESQLMEFEPLAQSGLVDTNRLRTPVSPRLNVERLAPVAARRLRFTITRTTDAEPCIDELEIFTTEPTPRNVALASAGTKLRASSVYPNSEIHRLEHLNDGRYGNGRSWISNERGRGWVELEFPETVTINRIVWGRDRDQKYSDRLALDYRIEVATAENDWRVVASSLDRVAYVVGRKPAPTTSLAGLAPAESARATELLAERALIEARLKELASAPMIYAGTFAAQPEPTFRLHRGDPMQSREVVTPGALQVVPVKFMLSSETNSFTTEQRQRLALARWIANPQNPLTARVLVNRVWQQHFGEGLVSTPSDFGANGARPTHPELLDWLAAEFMEHGWSLKHLHQLILTSATYRQSSAMRKDGLASDAGARLLWRFPPRRLEAEPIRDAVLAVSGKLDLRLGGPGFSAFEANDNYVRLYNPKQDFGAGDWRRMIYQTKIRMQQDGTFGAFDCPDGGQIAPKRTRSTTPLQALNLLNSPFLMQQAGFFAERLERDAGKDVKAQARRAFQLCLNRDPDRIELLAADKFIQTEGLVAFCRAIFNSNEFIYVY